MTRQPASGPSTGSAFESAGRQKWRGISSADVNGNWGGIAGNEFTAKDFRTRQRTAGAAPSPACSFRSGAASLGAVTAAGREAGEWL
ncbi:hypothetical protein [Arthrobacter sp. SDTb3-6]|uniref:hypothetical protein n=1 Tax=Arthrobacter sp. SDTb3-6 TaxID=2713571 RepID=UPI00159D134D|nr:hypothetical protein [Arthrobacter sp. SDTb3-6]NVM98706.1 hypothetical protein [Arthrobacter sp. SDTb3-6]